MEIGVLERILELRPGESGADRHVLRSLQISPQALHLLELGPQTRDHLERADITLVLGFEGDEHAPVVLRRIADADPEPHRHRVDRGIGHHDSAGLLLQPVHFRKRDVLRRLCRSEKNARVLLRKEPLGNDDEQIDGRDQGGDERQQSREAVAQHKIDSVLVAPRKGDESLLAQIIQPSVPFLVVALEKARRHHRRQGQRNERGHRDRHRNRDREFAEQPANDASHHEKRDENRDQRNRDGNDGEADFARAFQRRLERPFAVFDMARDVLQHHDRIVDDKADGDGESHQRQIVEAVAYPPHQRARPQERQGHCHARNDRRPEAAQEYEDHHDDERDGQHQGELDVAHRGANRQGAVGQDLDMDAGRNRRLKAGQGPLDGLDGVDDVRARLLEHDEKDAALAVGPRRLSRVRRARDRLADVAHANRGPIAVGDDHLVPGLGHGQLVVVIDRERLLGTDQRALGTVDCRNADLGAHVLELQVPFNQLGRIDLDAYRRLLLAPDAHQRHPRNLTDALGQDVLGRVVDLDDRRDVRLDGENENGRIRGIDLSIGRRTGQVFRQLSCGRVDRRLNIVGGRVDIALEIELNRYPGRAERTRRCHLRNAGNLRDLALERLGDRSGHRLRGGARQRRGDGYRRKIDLRQGRHGQVRIGDQADQEDGDHQQRRSDGAMDEGSGDASEHRP